MSLKSSAPAKPCVFIVSSSEQRDLVEHLGRLLKKKFHVTRWFDPAVFPAGTYPLDSLLYHARQAHIGLIICAGDDEVRVRNTSVLAPRDNVVFEAGLLMASLGRERCLLLKPQLQPGKNEIKIPSDLRGITEVRFNYYGTSKAKSEALEDVSKELDKVISRKPSGLCLSGTWRVSWVVESETFPKKNVSEVKLIQILDLVIGTYRVVDGAKSANPVDVQIRGVVKDHILNGEWKARSYQGVFQVKIDGSHNEMEGHWIGTSTRKEIKSGSYKLVRLDR